MALEIILASAKWRRVKGVRAAIAGAVKAAQPHVTPGDVTFMLADDAALRALNHQFRGKNKPTNVLAFESAPGSGDVALAFETVRAEAEAQGKSILAHVSHLAVHGLLHLSGHDHMKKAEAARMEALEIAILLRLGLSNPYLLKPERRGKTGSPRKPRK